MGCGSTASSHEGRILNTNVKWASVVHACNLSKRVTSLMSISLGYHSTLQPQTRTLQGCLQFSNNWVRRWTMPKPKHTSMQGSIVDRRSPSLWQKLTEAMAPPWLNWPLSPGKHQEARGLRTSLSPPGLPTPHNFPVSTMGNFQEIQLRKCISTNPYGMST